MDIIISNQNLKYMSFLFWWDIYIYVNSKYAESLPVIEYLIMYSQKNKLILSYKTKIHIYFFFNDIKYKRWECDFISHHTTLRFYYYTHLYTYRALAGKWELLSRIRVQEAPGSCQSPNIYIYIYTHIYTQHFKLLCWFYFSI